MAAHQAPPSLGFSRQERWSGLPFPSPRHESEVAQSCLCNPWTAARQASLSIIKSQSLLKLMFIESVMPSKHLILCHLLLLLPSIFSSIKVFSNESVHIRWPKYWSFSFSISPSNVYSGLVSFKIVGSPCSSRDSQESSPTPHSSKASILQRSAFFIVQLSHSYMTTGKTIALTRQNFVGKVTSLVFNMLSRLVITFLPRSNHLLISWLQSPSAVTLEPPKIVCHCFHCFLIYLPWSDGTRCTRPSFPLSQSFPSGSFHKPLILLHQRADRLKTTITEN